MYLNLKEFTGAINKITDMVSSDKNVPGILLRLVKDEADSTEGLLSVCYSDGHKALVQELKASLEESDIAGDVATTYEQLTSAISSCQPHGKIEVDLLRIEYFPNILKLSVDQYVSSPDESGEDTTRTKMGTKYIDVVRLDLEHDIRVKNLARQKYDSIFQGEQLDEYNRTELIELLNKTSTEKGKLIYFSSIKQEVLVANQAYAVACKVSGYDLGEDEKQAIKQELENNGITDDKSFESICKDKTDRIHFSIVVFQQMAKSISSVLSRLSSDTVYIEKVDSKFCNIFVDNEDEKVGIWFEMPKGSSVHLNYVESFSSLEYKTYQMTFLKDLIEDAVKQALNTTKSEQVEVKIEAEPNEDGRIIYYMVIQGGSSSASTSNLNRFMADDIVDSVGNIADKKFDISLKVLNDMISQIKTDLLAFDIEESEGGSIKLRVSEINMEKQNYAYDTMRKGLDDTTPTPIESKLEWRDMTLGTRQFTMLSK